MMYLDPQDYATAMHQLNEAKDHDEKAKLFKAEYRVLTYMNTALINGAVAVGIEDAEGDIDTLNSVTRVFAQAANTETKVATLEPELIAAYLTSYDNLTNAISLKRFGITSEDFANILFDDEGENDV